MGPERWQQLEKLYHSASERHPSQRSAFLDEECRGDQQLRAELELLLAKDNSPQALLDRPVWQASGYSSASVSIGTQLGAYRIESVLGQGGMGVVFRAYDTKLHRPGCDQVPLGRSRRCGSSTAFSAGGADGVVAEPSAHSDRL